MSDQPTPAKPAAGPPGSTLGAPGGTVGAPGGTPGAPGGTPGAPGPRSLWKDKANGVTVYRHPAPLVLWWVWIAFALANLFYLVTDGINIHSLRGIALIAFITGVMYACTLHARVESDEGGVTIVNPLRRHRTPWGALEGIYLGDSVEFSCLRPAPQKPKTIYSWALYSRRRSAARMQIQRDVFVPKRMSGRAPAEATALVKQHPSKIMAAELGRRAAAARERAGIGGVLSSRWTWLPVAAVVVPGVLLLVAMLAR
ncbi:MAG TPA: PH domain-containing protein [Streptosporangiaceae bacterium]|nr:PH domain-containing protein [Streptosporangiaceae bacterium]